MSGICHVTVGLPASGKTTFAKSLGVLRFNLDDLRDMMGTGRETWTDEREKLATAIMIEGAATALLAGHDVVIDNTHMVPRLPNRYREVLKPLGVTFRVHDFTGVGVAECHARNNGREASVPSRVIDDMAARLANAQRDGWRLTDEWMNR